MNRPFDMRMRYYPARKISVVDYYDLPLSLGSTVLEPRHSWQSQIRPTASEAREGLGALMHPKVEAEP